MKKIMLFLICLQMISCHKKKLTEVVEVPLPTKEEKIEIGDPDDIKAVEGAFELQKLGFKYSALEPNIDALTMETHYAKHYLNYTNNLNTNLTGTELQNNAIEDILKKLDLNNADLRNNAGGYYNHTLYFDNLSSKSTVPQDTLASAINKDFGSFENLKTQLNTAAAQQFGSGWAWLIVDKTGTLKVCSTANQDNPLMPTQLITGIPILAIDVWEHAYYLKYLNQRQKYLDAFFNIIDWKKVGEKYEAALKK